MVGPARTEAEKRAFRSVFWGLAIVEAIVIAFLYRERFGENFVGTLLMVLFVPVLVLGHVNVFPAIGAAWLVRRRARKAQAAGRGGRAVMELQPPPKR